MHIYKYIYICTLCTYFDIHLYMYMYCIYVMCIYVCVFIYTYIYIYTSMQNGQTLEDGNILIIWSEHK